MNHLMEHSDHIKEEFSIATKDNHAFPLYICFVLWLAVYGLGSLGAAILGDTLRGILFLIIPGCVFVILFVKYNGKSRFVIVITTNEILCAVMMIFIFINLFTYRNKIGEVMIMIAGITFFMILIRLKGWQGISLNVMRWYAYIHIALGYFLWFKPDIIRNSLIYLYDLNEHSFNVCMDMVDSGYMMGVFNHYSSMGMIVGTALVLVCAKHLFSAEKRVNVMGILIISITLFSVFLTGKRGILLFATAAVLITYFWFYSKADILGKILKLSVGAVAMLLIAYFIFRDVNIVNQVFVSLGRFSPFGHTSLNSFSNGRIGLWTLAWELFLQNPVFGAGWGAYYDLLTYDRHFDVHNVYLQLLCETGIVGFSVFMLFFIRTLVNTYQLLVREDQAVKKQHLSFSFCMQIFFLLYCFTGNPLYEHYTFIPYIIACAITYSAYYKSHLLVSPIRIDTEKGGDRVQGKEAEYMAAVITVHHVCNYGTQLQAFATQEKLKQYYDDVVFIDYRRRDTYGLGLMRIFTKGNPLKIPIILPTLVYWWYLFGGFRKKYLHLTKQVYLKDADFDSFDDCADVYFSGSDQIWNTGWNGGVIPAFYLSFAPEDKPKFAFASSFGKIRFTEDEITQSKKYIDRFCAISVREESGVSVLKEQYGYDNCLRIVDPTLCMPASFWRSVALPSKINDDYILIYNLYRSHMLDKYAAELSRRTGLKLYRFCTRFDHVLRNGKSLMMPKIFEFVTLIDNAKYVLTDSFHATAFSMNLNTEPICVYPDCYSGRISEFLDLLGEGQRHILSFEDFDVLERHVDFERVNMILDEERHRADKFLEQITSENIRRGKWNQ